jgi:UPF0755 protein
MSQKKKRKGRAGLLFLLLLGTLAGVAGDGWMQLNAPLAISRADTVELESGQRLNSLSRQLDNRGLFDNPRQRLYLLAYARLHGEAALLKAGEYAVEPGLTPLGLLATLTSGKVLLHELRIIEGWRFAQAWKLIQADPNVNHTLGEANAEAVMQALGKAGMSPEGRFFPDTYRFPRHTSDLTLLRNAYAAMDKVLSAEWAGRAPELSYTSPEQALTMASLVEKETGAAAERPLIAGVFLRRLHGGMRLQTDPAVIYGLGDAYDGNIHVEDLRTDTPYNTYTRDGLPPTPICLPGRDAIHAALHPDQGRALYFVSKGDGSHQFSDTLEEHNAAVMRYQIKPHLHP